MENKKNVVKLHDKDLEQIDGGATLDEPGITGESGITYPTKGWVCKNCGNIQGTWVEYGSTMATTIGPFRCDKCGATNSFEIKTISE